MARDSSLRKEPLTDLQMRVRLALPDFKNTNYKICDGDLVVGKAPLEVARMYTLREELLIEKEDKNLPGGERCRVILYLDMLDKAIKTFICEHTDGKPLSAFRVTTKGKIVLLAAHRDKQLAGT